MIMAIPLSSRYNLRALALIILTSFIACESGVVSGKKKQPGLRSIESCISTALNGVGIECSTRTRHADDTLFVSVEIPSPRFLGAETYKMLTISINYHCYPVLNNYKGVYWNFIPRGFEHDPIVFAQSDSSIQDGYVKMNGDSSLLSLTRYVLSRMHEEDLLRVEKILRIIGKSNSSAIDARNFWLFMNGYIQSCVESDSDQVLREYNRIFSLLEMDGTGIDVRHIRKLRTFCDR
jgi:hypothetical protein